MKGLMKVATAALAVSSLLAPTAAWAAFTPAELLEATKIAVDDFSTANPDHVEHFTGYKAWKSGEDAKVKIYVAHDGMNMEFNFTCHKHDDGTECHAQ